MPGLEQRGNFPPQQEKRKHEVENDPIVKVIKAAVAKVPELTFVSALQNDKDLMEDNLYSIDSHLHDVYMFIASSHPEYDLNANNQNLQKLLSNINSSDLGRYVEVVSPERSQQKKRKNFIEFPHFKVAHHAAYKKTDITSIFKPTNQDGEIVLQQNNIPLEGYRVHTSGFPSVRTIHGAIYPSVAFANLAATCKDMEFTEKSDKPKYPIRRASYYTQNILEGMSQDEYARLIQDEKYLQAMADKTLKGYVIPGLHKPQPERFPNKLVERLQSPFI